MRDFSLKTWSAKFSAAMLLIILTWGCGRVPHLTEVAPPSSRLPFVKVLLGNEADRHVIGPVGSSEIAIDCYKKKNRQSYFSRRPVIIIAIKNRLALYTHEGNNLDYNIDRMVISARGRGRELAFDDRQYRGLFELKASSGQIKLVNIVYVEDYLKGVVPLEIGSTPPEQYEAIKAQAVAARTYAMAHLGQYGEEAGYDLQADIGDQVYQGISIEEELVSQAVEATHGEVLVYNDKMIEAYYHSTCGGETDDIEDVWEKDPRPYLVMVQDNDACQISKYFTWEERFTADQVILRLEQYLSQERGKQVKLGKLTDIRITSRTPGGRVASIVFETAAGHQVFRKEKVRWVLRRSDNTDAILRSARFDVELRRDSQGNISEVLVKGRGYGHGVGMCQMGSRGMAEDGIWYDSILALYYQGTNLKRMY